MVHASRLLVLASLTLGALGCWSGRTSPASVVGAPLSPTAEDGSRIEEVLKGKVPGLSLQRRPDGTYSVRMRGARAPGGGEPLVLLDGVPMGGSAGIALAEIDPRQVQRVEVIRDAASLTLYGSRGANGVIAITTRSR